MSSELSKDAADKIGAFLKENNISKAHLARYSSVSIGTLNHILEGKSTVRLHSMLRVLYSCGMTITFFPKEEEGV